MKLWYPGASKREGPSSKVGYGAPVGRHSRKLGDIKHSAEGFWGGLYSVLDSTRKRASWHFTIGYNRVEQHYPINANCWHAGRKQANIDYIGIEHLGTAGTILTDYQQKETAKLSYWLAEQNNRANEFLRYPGSPVAISDTSWYLIEHNEVSIRATACPSDRINWRTVMFDLRLLVDKQDISEEDDSEMTFIGVGCDENLVGTSGFKSYRLYVTDKGLKRISISTKEQRESLDAGGYPLIKMTKSLLDEYKE